MAPTMSDKDETVVGIFPDQAISEILVRLPAKSICRFKCVSKRWLSVISSPHFLSSYISHSTTATNTPSWVILDRAIWVEEEGPENSQVSLTLSEVPNVSTLKIPAEIVDMDLYDPAERRVPFVISGSNCGLVLLAIAKKRDPYGKGENKPGCFSLRTSKNSLVVCNPITHQLFVLPDPPDLLNDRRAIGFVCRGPGPDGLGSGFVVVEYQPLIGSESATLFTFSSKKGRWEEKSANYMLGMHFWRPGGVVEFDGHLLWLDMSCGMIVWDEPFGDEEMVKLRFVPLPEGCRRRFDTPDLEKQRTIGVGGGFVQYLEVVNHERVLKLWRLEDFQGGEWGLVHRVELKDVWHDRSYLGYGLPKATPIVRLIHPFESDVAFLVVGESILEVHLGNKTVRSCGVDSSLFGLVIPFVIPAWPPSFDPFFLAISAKERGNEHFKAKDFKEAIAYYSRSICHSPSAAAYANRAAAYLKIHDYTQAENDCTEAIKLDDEYMKAYARRATARKQLGKLEEAKQDAERCLKIDPRDDVVLKLQAEINSLMKKVVIKDDGEDVGVPDNDK